jgi:hypothetical protein
MATTGNPAVLLNVPIIATKNTKKGNIDNISKNDI